MIPDDAFVEAVLYRPDGPTIRFRLRDFLGTDRSGAPKFGEARLVDFEGEPARALARIWCRPEFGPTIEAVRAPRRRGRD